MFVYTLTSFVFFVVLFLFYAPFVLLFFACRFFVSAFLFLYLPPAPAQQ